MANNITDKQAFIKLQSQDGLSFLELNPKQGGALQTLSLNKQLILKDQGAWPYGSAVLFPFANRVAKGVYNFNGEIYQLEKSEEDPNNALHGLVYNKPFEVVEKVSDSESTSVLLQHTNKQRAQGFPFLYTISLRYKLLLNALELSVIVKNDDAVPFPFTLGWHPYFNAPNLETSSLALNTSHKILVDETMIPLKEVPYNIESPLLIQDQSFDDCFKLNTNRVTFKTSTHDIAITASKGQYWQIYTPPSRQVIAIEPQTGPADSFNNNLGLQVLKPHESYQLQWGIQIQ